MTAPAKRVFILALGSRALVLSTMLLCDWCFSDLDSSARLQGFPCAGGSDTEDRSATATATARKPLLAVWDTVYFARVARCGYETDKNNAFFPAMPGAMRALGGAASGLLGLLGVAHPLPPEAAHAAAGLGFNAAAFCIAALCLHRLGTRVLGGGASNCRRRGRSHSHSSTASRIGKQARSGSSGRSSSRSGSELAHEPGQLLDEQQEQPQQPRAHEGPRQQEQKREHAADLALLLFCFNPASVFYSAAYSEALFAAATWTGLLLLPTHHWAGVAALAAAGAARSNGILGVWFPLHKALAAAARQGRLTVREAARAALSCAAIVAPYATMQALAYLAHCTDYSSRTTSSLGSMDSMPAYSQPPPPAWCSSCLPSVYGFIQREYWDVGLLRFYQDPSRLPMVLMSAPVALLSITGCWSYFASDWQRALTLGLFSRGDRLPRWLAAPARTLQRWWRMCANGWAAATRHGSRRHRRQQQQGQQQQGQVQRQRQRSEVAAAGLAAQGSAVGGGPLQHSQEAAPLMYHWALMTAVAFLAMHVNVATRFLSACPPLYWHAAGVLAAGGLRARLLWLWCLAYIALGCLLFPNFYPWT